jgi:hypothetical protein
MIELESYRRKLPYFDLLQKLADSDQVVAGYLHIRLSILELKFMLLIS